MKALSRPFLHGLLLLATALVAGCSDNETTEETRPATESQPAVPDAVVEVAVQARADLCDGARSLEEQVTQLVQSPSPENLQQARDAWKAAHESWRIWRLLQRVASDGEPLAPEDRIDAQPILPGYLDRVPGYPASGLAFSEVPLDPEALAEAHQSTDVYYGVLGFHPLEFMLWGVPDGEGAPTRKAEAFRDRAEAGGDAIPTPARRRALITSMAALLSVDLAQTCAPAQPPQWLPALAQRMDNDGRRQTLAWWLQTLADDMARWQENPEGEDRNGMPLRHSAFARTDFKELNAELGWLAEHHWPADGPKRAAADNLRDALSHLADTAAGAEAGGGESIDEGFGVIGEAALSLARELSPPDSGEPAEEPEEAGAAEQAN